MVKKKIMMLRDHAWDAAGLVMQQTVSCLDRDSQ